MSTTIPNSECRMPNAGDHPIASVTGATGFLGWHLCEALRDSGWSVRAIVRPGNRKALPAGVQAVESPLDVNPLCDAVAGCALVVHSAAVVRAATDAEIHRVNVEGTRAAVSAANAAGARLLFISSQAAIGPGTVGHPSRENDTPHPLTMYGRSKLAAEALVRDEACIPWTIVRPSAVYGPRDRGFLPLFRLASRGLFPMVASARTAFTFIHVDDLIRALMLAASSDRAVGGTFFLGHPTPSTAEDLTRALAAAYGRTYRPIPVPRVAVRIAGIVGDVCWMMGMKPPVDSARAAEVGAGGFVCSVDRARDALGFTAARPLADGVAQTARWYRDRAWV